MVGRDVVFRIERTRAERGAPVLQVENISARNDKGPLALNGATFTIHEGEVFGIAGISGNGQHELAEVLAGLRRVDGGQVFFNGEDITHSSVLERWQMGIGYIPSQRVEVGSIAGFSLVENVAMNYYFEPGFSRRGILDYGKLRDLTAEIVSEYDVATPSPTTKAQNLSGGNLQRLILARVLSRRPRLIIACLPTQGLDVGATEFVRNKLMELKKEKSAILLISEDLDEVLSLSDSVAPIYEGQLMGIIPAEEAMRDRVGAMMAGLHLKGAVS